MSSMQHHVKHAESCQACRIMSSMQQRWTTNIHEVCRYHGSSFLFSLTLTLHPQSHNNTLTLHPQSHNNTHQNYTLTLHPQSHSNTHQNNTRLQVQPHAARKVGMSHSKRALLVHFEAQQTRSSRHLFQFNVLYFRTTVWYGALLHDPCIGTRYTTF